MTRTHLVVDETELALELADLVDDGGAVLDGSSRVAARAGKGSLVVLDHLGQVHGLEVHHPSYAQRVVVIVVVVVLISFGLVTSEKIDD